MQSSEPDDTGARRTDAGSADATTRPALRELFESALALPAAERYAYLVSHCTDARQREAVLRMLAADAQDTSPLLDEPLDALLARVGEPAAHEALPADSRIGPFTLMEKLGEGGSSIVFRAMREQAGVRQMVALKLLRRALYTPDEHRRFRSERLALTQLRHPGIAHLVEGGVTDTGIPYIALELVDGEPITDHARSRRLDLRQRLGLFLQVCRAVEAAHRALIVHRDLKPSNVLVTRDGTVKLLDFGIAKLLDVDSEAPEAHTQHRAMTPAYAAPEQFRDGPITTATDVYALGILLGELMTGHRREPGETCTPSSQVSQDTGPGVLPAEPAKTRRQLRGDLDNIMLKAMAEEAERRYASAGTLADDIERFLADQPVDAHPPSRWYRMRKFMTRHRGGVLSTALLLLAILAALGLALWQANLALHAAQRGNAMRDFIVTAFSEAEPGVPREGPPRITEVVEQAIATARVDTGMNEAVRVELVSQLGAVLREQGQLVHAQETLQWNHERAQRAFGPASALTLEAGHQLAATQILGGDFDAARTLIDRSLAHVTARDGALAASLHFDSALLASKQHELERARADAGTGLRIARGLDDDNALSRALAEYGNVQLVAGDVAGATASWEELLAIRMKRFGPTHLSVAEVHANLSRAYRRGGDIANAEKHIRAALAIDAAVLPVEDWRHANHLNALMMLLLQQRDYRAALDAASEGLRINRRVLGEDHPEIANDLNSVGMLHALLEEFDGALEPLRESLQRCEAKFGSEHYETAVARANYGVVLTHTGDVAAGEAEIAHALASLEAAAEPDFDEQAATLEKLVRVRLDRRDFNGALPLLPRIDALVAKLGAAPAYWDGRVATLHATALLQSGDAAQALARLAVARRALQASSHADAVLKVEVPLLQATAARQLDDQAAAHAFAQEGLQALAGLRNPPARVAELARRLQQEAPAGG